MLVGNEKIKLLRTYLVGSTVGVLTKEGKEICFTLELPDLENKQQISCIPTGVYEDCYFTEHYKFGLSCVVPDVKGRKGILIHSGNSLIDTKGCILVGSGMSSTKYMTGSRNAMKHFKSKVASPFFDLEIF